jgi:hypothetical protein
VHGSRKERRPAPVYRHYQAGLPGSTIRGDVVRFDLPRNGIAQPLVRQSRLAKAGVKKADPVILVSHITCSRLDCTPLLLKSNQRRMVCPHGLYRTSY